MEFLFRFGILAGGKCLTIKDYKIILSKKWFIFRNRAVRNRDRRYLENHKASVN